MKKNLSFLLAFLLLFSFTYIYEKVGKEDKSYEQEENKKIFNVTSYGELTKIETPYVLLKKNKQGFLVGKKQYPADPLVIRKMFDLFGNMKAVRFLNEKLIKDKYKEFFGEGDKKVSFIFEHGKLECIVGNKLEYGQSFYLHVTKENKSEYLIAKVDKPLVGVYSKEEEATSSYFHDQLTSFVQVKEDLFYERRIFIGLSPTQLTSLSFPQDHFSINFTDGTIDPPLYKGIEISSKKLDDFRTRFVALRSKSVLLDVPQSDLKNLISEIKFKFSGKVGSLLLFRKLKDSIGWFIWNTHSKRAFYVERDVSRFFFQKAQVFWDRRIVYNKPTHVTLVQKRLILNLINDSGWKINKEGSRSLDQKKIQKLFALLYKEADQVEYSSNLINESKYKMILEISVLGKQFTVLESLGDLIFWNKKDKLIYHFWVGQNLPFDPKIDNYFL